MWSEIETQCPVLVSILQDSLPSSVMKKDNVTPSLCVCASIPLKLRNSHMNIVQAMISLLLKSGHASKQVKTIALLCNRKITQFHAL